MPEQLLGPDGKAMMLPRRISVRGLIDDADLALTGGIECLQHGRFLDHAVLHEALRETPEPGALASERQRSVIVHGFVASD